MLSINSFSDSTPYPPVKVECPNLRYANEMLSNTGSCNSEMSAVSLYFYNSVILMENRKDFADIFHEISIVEMHHLDIFSQLAFMLGADPRLWTYQGRGARYWSPACNHYPRPLAALLQNALLGEQNTIAKYRWQASLIQDRCITNLLNRIILDEQVHVSIFQAMLAEISCG
ncbi:rubrerythrin family protein [Clostridium sp. MCC353]|uniref:ferritin-like domain-containing protein n=1 Tax=Clostridium sp. MCC353 TaxID=2592646 RepID=UPI001C02F632|nr:ferritin family protein [Clostridium sp. MCC353]MBT9779419.1 rubrerythrin family protein [Clostridium sp. MCC353]